MMKLTIVLLAVIGCVLAASPPATHPEVPILRSASDINVDGSFSFGYETGDGTSHDASGNVDGVQGRFAYVSPEGQRIETSYVATADGFVATGAHIPTVPEYIVRAIAYIRAHPPPKEV